jgi:hypothetical protein
MLEKCEPTQGNNKFVKALIQEALSKLESVELFLPLQMETEELKDERPSRVVSKL